MSKIAMLTCFKSLYRSRQRILCVTKNMQSVRKEVFDFCSKKEIFCKKFENENQLEIGFNKSQVLFLSPNDYKLKLCGVIIDFALMDGNHSDYTPYFLESIVLPLIDQRVERLKLDIYTFFDVCCDHSCLYESKIIFSEE